MTFQQILLDPSLQWQFPSQLGLGRLWKLPTMGVITISSVLRWYGSRLWFVVRQIPNRWAYEVFGRLLLLQDSLFAPWFRCFCKFANEDCCVCVCAPMYIVRLEICVAIAKKSMDTPATEVSHMFSPGWCSGYNATSAVGASITMPGGRGGVSSSNKVFSCWIM